MAGSKEMANFSSRDNLCEENTWLSSEQVCEASFRRSLFEKSSKFSRKFERCCELVLSQGFFRVFLFDKSR